jgi:hypothetical protein
MNDVVHGYNDARFDKVRQALEDAITTGEEVGAARTIGWGEDTIVNVWSSTKTVGSPGNR